MDFWNDFNSIFLMNANSKCYLYSFPCTSTYLTAVVEGLTPSCVPSLNFTQISPFTNCSKEIKHNLGLKCYRNWGTKFKYIYNKTLHYQVPTKGFECTCMYKTCLPVTLNRCLWQTPVWTVLGHPSVLGCCG